jgi:major type 1 subunit fimbrin (pilin)
MKLKALVAALVATSGLLGMTAAQASDGTVTFTGSIVATSCVITGGGNIAVTLPPVDASALSASGKTATPTQFSIAMTACPATTSLHALFEIGANVDTTTGNLKNTGTATNVEISLLNSALGAINIATQANDGAGTGLTTTTAGAYTLNYYAQYIATGAAGAGTVASSVTYSLVYN